MTIPAKPERAFVLRQSPGGVSRLESVSLPNDVIVNGWSAAPNLVNESEYSRFREILRQTYYSGDPSLRRAGYAASTMWRFIKEMKPRDWIVVPHWGGTFYVAEIIGDAYRDATPAAMQTDTAYRRRVTWLNDKSPIPRRLAKTRLISRMKTQQTSAEAKDLIDEIAEAMELARLGEIDQQTPDSDRLFADKLRLKVVEAVLAEIHHGVGMDDFKFEQLVRRVVLANGASAAEIIGRRKDKGVDIKATFPIGRLTPIEIGIQVKHHVGTTKTKWIDQLIEGLDKENLSLGWFVTSGTFEKGAEEHLAKQLEGRAMQIQLVDGEQLAGMLVEAGLANFTS